MHECGSGKFSGSVLSKPYEAFEIKWKNTELPKSSSISHTEALKCISKAIPWATPLGKKEEEEER